MLLPSKRISKKRFLFLKLTSLLSNPLRKMRFPILGVKDGTLEDTCSLPCLLNKTPLNQSIFVLRIFFKKFVVCLKLLPDIFCVEKLSELKRLVIFTFVKPIY
jgi:hypothetical protein